jgi:2-(1,2-epoxy-1,2-dihydrophenyl)acetyl-CoA isomerase
VVALLNGAAAGGGFAMALACDLRIMAESAFMQQAYTSNGLAPDGGATWTLPRILGLAKALELVMLDPRLGSAECLRLGLAAEVVPDAEFRPRGREICLKLAAMPVCALGRTKALLSASLEVGLEARLREEEVAIAEQGAGPEGQEGIAAFLEKRRPAFR